MKIVRENARFAIVAILLFASGLFLRSRRHNILLSPGTSLAVPPLQLGDWSGTEIPFLPRTLATLGPGEYVQRSYREDQPGEPPVDLYLAHRPNQHSLRFHSLNECLIGSGWSIIERGTTTLALPDRRSFRATRYLLANSSGRQVVLLWYWMNGRSVPNQQWLSFYSTLDFIRFDREDNLLVRINTPVHQGETIHDAELRLLSFAARLSPFLGVSRHPAPLDDGL